MAILPHLTFSEDLPTLTSQLTQNTTATVDSLSIRLIGRVVSVVRYSATGATTGKLPIPMRRGFSPYAVLLVRAAATNDPGADLSAVGRPNFTQPDATTLHVYEPSGLVANTFYDLTFLVLETQ